MTDYRTHGYCWTWNNYTEADILYVNGLINKPRPLISYLCYGKEIAPTTGTPHLQGYIHFKNAQPFDTVKKLFPKQHLEAQRGTIDQAIDYCKEDGDFTEFGEKPKQGERTDLKPIYDRINAGEDLDNIIMENPDVYNRAHRAMHRLEDIQMRKRRRKEMTEGEWIYGESGTGKSEYAFQHENAYVYPYDNGWCDGYKQEDIVIIDEFRGQLPYNELLRMVDKHPNYFLRRRCRETIPFTSKKVIITSSLPPYKVFKNLEVGDSFKQLFRRFKVYKLTEEGLEEETYEDYLNKYHNPNTQS